MNKNRKRSQQLHNISNSHNKHLEKYNITNIKKQSTPCTGDNLMSENKKQFNTTIFKSAIGLQIYIAKISCPDISFAFHKIEKNQNPLPYQIGTKY